MRAQDTQWNRATLERLGGVFVRIEVNDVCAGAGVTAADFEAKASLGLIEAGVGVLTRDEQLRNPALPELTISLDCAQAAGDQLAYAVGLRVQQAAQMLRDTQVTLPEAVTWHTVRVGAAQAVRVGAALEATLAEGLGTFSEAWSSANAERGSR